jgi:hypothetical protein
MNMSFRRYKPLLVTVCYVGLAFLAFFWAIFAGYWGWNWLRGGRDAARAWLMHTALLGQPFEGRTMAQTINHIHAAYEELILLLLVTFLLYLVQRLLKRDRGRPTD